MNKLYPCILLIAVLTISCDSGNENTAQEMPRAKLSPELVAIMNPFALDYGTSPVLPPELTPRPDSWPRGVIDQFTVPLDEGAELSMFADFEITTIPPENVIYASTAKRAYPDSISCDNAREHLSQIVQRKFPNLESTNLGFENSEFGIYVVCTYQPGDRFISLKLEIFHKESRDLIAIPEDIKSQYKN